MNYGMVVTLGIWISMILTRFGELGKFPVIQIPLSPREFQVTSQAVNDSKVYNICYLGQVQSHLPFQINLKLIHQGQTITFP